MASDFALSLSLLTGLTISSVVDGLLGVDLVMQAIFYVLSDKILSLLHCSDAYQRKQSNVFVRCILKTADLVLFDSRQTLYI